MPLLYVGLEYGLTNNSKLAERFLNQALTIAPDDPFVLHEIGVIAFQSLESVVCVSVWVATFSGGGMGIWKVVEFIGQGKIEGKAKNLGKSRWICHVAENLKLFFFPGSC